MINKILVIPTHGFGNRIKLLSSAQILANYLNIDIINFHINWQLEETCNIDYNKIFTNDPNSLNLSQINKYKYHYNPNIHTNNILSNLDKLEEQNIELLILQGGHCFKHPKMTEDEYILKKNIVYKNFSFTKFIQQKVNHIDWSQNLIGIHARRYIVKHDEPDNLNSNGLFEHFRCNMNIYYDMIDKILLKDKTKKFFISTNDDNIKNEIINKYNECIIYHQFDDFNRESENGVINSIIDILSLSKCEFIIGTYYSSFSDEACFFNNISKMCVPLINRKEEYHTYGYNNSSKCLLYQPSVIRKYF